MPEEESKGGDRTLFIPSRGYIDERLAALLRLIEASMAPALALLPKAKRQEIESAYDELKGLVSDGRDE